VRKSLAAVTREIGNIFAGEVEAFLAEEARARRGLYEKVEFVGQNKIDSDTKVSPKEKRVRKIATRLITVVVCFRWSSDFLHVNMSFSDEITRTCTVSFHSEI
jgi:hypothetical protein